MFRTNVEDIKKHESAPQTVEIFSKKEIQKMSDFYNRLPLRVFNQAQNVKKKAWIQGIDMQLDRTYFDGLKRFLGDYKMDNLKSEDGMDLFGLYHESFNPLPLHVDSGFKPEEIIYKQALTPFTSGQTVVFKNKWYGRSTSFTIDSEELKFKPVYEIEHAVKEIIEAQNNRKYEDPMHNPIYFNIKRMKEISLK